MHSRERFLSPPKVTCHGRRIAALAIILVALTVSKGIAAPVQRGATSVAIGGMTPGGRVAWVSVSREPQRWHERVVARAEITIANESGVAAFNTPVPISAKSIWIAVEVEMGAIGMTDDLFTARPANELRDALPVLASAGRVRLRGGTQEILVVRPGAEAWTGRTGDGWPDDDDGTVNGELTLTTDSLRPLIGEGAFSGFKPGDILVAIDHDRMECAAIRIDEAMR